MVYQSQSDGSVPLSSSEMEYASPRYEDLKPRLPELPSSPRPMAKLSTMSRVGVKDCTNIVPTASTNVLMGTMKLSEVYGS